MLQTVLPALWMNNKADLDSPLWADYRYVSVWPEIYYTQHTHNHNIRAVWLFYQPSLMAQTGTCPMCILSLTTFSKAKSDAISIVFLLITRFPLIPYIQLFPQKDWQPGCWYINVEQYNTKKWLCIRMTYRELHFQILILLRVVYPFVTRRQLILRMLIRF